MAVSTTALTASGTANTTAFTVNVTVSSASRTRATVGTIEEGENFVSTAFAVTAVSDPGGDMDIALMNGQEQVAPEEDRHTMATDEVVLPAVALYDTGSTIEAELDNRDNTSQLEVSVLVAGIEPDKLDLLESV